VVLHGACLSAKGIKQPVTAVDVTGNTAFADEEIIDGLATRPPHGTFIKVAQEFDANGLELDRQRIESFYREHGYFDAHVLRVDVKKTDKDHIEVTIAVEEGQPTRIALVDVTGADTGVARQILASRTGAALRTGSVFDHAAYETTKRELQDALVKKGYALASVDGSVAVDRPSHRAWVRLTITPGALVHFGTVAIRGQKTVAESAIRNRVAWNEGDVYDPEKIKATEDRIYALGLFSSVRTTVGFQPDSDRANMTILVAEGMRHELSLGFGVGLDTWRYEVKTKARYTQRNILGSPLTTFRAEVEPGWYWLRSDTSTTGPSLEATVSVSHEDFLMPRATGKVLTAYEYEPRIGYILTGPRLELSLLRRFFKDDRFSVYVGWNLHYLSYLNADPTVFGSAATPSLLGYFEQRLAYDGRDVPLEARRGFYLGLTLDEGGNFALGQEQFFKLLGEARGYLSLAPRLVLAVRALAGFISSSAEESPLPVRFYGGGGNDHRGFGYERLSPQKHDSEGNVIPTGGDGRFLATVETRIDLFKIGKEWLGAALFLDGGDVVTPVSALDLGNLNWAIGFGLRYDTPVGPIRFDLGIRLNRTEAAGADGLANPDPGSHVAFHISIGEAF
jgi:outer membrane protein assembly complex protein YaeT